MCPTKIYPPGKEGSQGVLTFNISVNIAKSTNNSVSMDKHMIKQKYDQIKEMFEAENYEKVVFNSKHIMLHL